MLKAIYTPMSGALAQEKVLEIIANNLANVNTVGFKGDSVSFKLLEPEPEKNYKSPLPPANYKIPLDDVYPLHGNDIAYVGVAGIHRDESQGPAIQTSNDTDIMIQGEGHLAVNTQEGMRYTRSGQLSLGPNGALVTPAGHPVMGEKGAITLQSGKFEINHRGEIYQNNQMVDRLQLYSFSDTASMERAGMNLWHYSGPDEGRMAVKDPSVMQGFLEGSNVNAIKNLTSMIIAHRSYEAYQKAVSNYDKMMEISNNQLGAVRA
ncbi:MAG: flagellar basal-body rod protein FlgF [Proteobacteria bacterium]|nr:flagellar basal-body rod protein FlgF [Pseudomonadota bacterium]